MRTEISSVRELPEMHLLGHTCTNLHGDLLFVWGGTNESVAFSSAPNTSLWIYESLTGYWRHKICTGECPPYLSSCSSCLIGQKMYIFGGHSTAQDNWLNSLYCLDLDTFIWRDVGSQARAEPTKPIRSDKNVCWSYDKKLYVFGGYGWSQAEHYSALLDCQKDLQLTPDFRWPKFGWNNQLVEYDPADKTWRWPNYKGKCPSARAAHSGALMGDKYFVFGGRDSKERLNDLYTLDMRTLEWQQIAVIASPGSLVDILANEQRLPLRHLLDDESHGNEIGASNGHDSMDLMMEDENDRQLVEEMHDVQVEDDDERWNSLPSSSVNINEEQQSNISAEQPQEETPNEDFEYPHPSHLLERWSLSSSSNPHESNVNHQGGDQNNSECLYDTQEDRILHQDSVNTVNSSSQATHQAQNLMPLIVDGTGNSHIDQLSESNSLATTEQPQDLNLQYQESNRQWQQARDAGGDVQRAIASPSSDQINGGAPERNQAMGNDEPRADDTISAQQQMQQQGQQPQQQGCAVPAGRSFCSLTPISGSDMLLFGGVDSQDRNLDDCWLFNINTNQWTQITDFKHKRPRLWHTGARTKQNEVVIIGGSSSEKIDEFCSDVLVMSFEAKSLKRLALDAVSRSVRMKTIQRTKGLPATLIKLIKLRKQAMALTMRRSASQRSLPVPSD